MMMTFLLFLILSSIVLSLSLTPSSLASSSSSYTLSEAESLLLRSRFFSQLKPDDLDKEENAKEIKHYSFPQSLLLVRRARELLQEGSRRRRQLVLALETEGLLQSLVGLPEASSRTLLEALRLNLLNLLDSLTAETEDSKNDDDNQDSKRDTHLEASHIVVCAGYPLVIDSLFSRVDCSKFESEGNNGSDPLTSYYCAECFDAYEVHNSEIGCGNSDTPESTRSVESVLKVPLLLMHHGFATYQAGRRATALASFQSSLNISRRLLPHLPSFALAQAADVFIRAQGGIALVHIDKGLPEDALVMLQAAVSHFNNSICNIKEGTRCSSVAAIQLGGQLLILRGQCLLQLGQYLSAQASFDEATNWLNSTISIDFKLEDMRKTAQYGTKTAQCVMNDEKRLCNEEFANGCHENLASCLLFPTRGADQSSNNSHSNECLKCLKQNDARARRTLENASISQLNPSTHEWSVLLNYSKQLIPVIGNFWYGQNSSNAASMAHKYKSNTRRSAALTMAALQINVVLASYAFDKAPHCSPVDEDTTTDTSLKQRSSMKPVDLCSLSSTAVGENHWSYLFCQNENTHHDLQRPRFVDLVGLAVTWHIVSHPVEDSGSRLINGYRAKRSTYSDDELPVRRMYLVHSGSVNPDYQDYITRLFHYTRQHLLKRGFHTFYPEHGTGTNRLHSLSLQDMRKVVAAETFEELLFIVNSSFSVCLTSDETLEDVSSGPYTVWQLHITGSHQLSVYLTLPGDQQRSGILSENIRASFDKVFDVMSEIFSDVQTPSKGLIRGLQEHSLRLFYHWAHLSPFRLPRRDDFVGVSLLTAVLSLFVAPEWNSTSPYTQYVYMEALLSSTSRKFVMKYSKLMDRVAETVSLSMDLHCRRCSMDNTVNQLSLSNMAKLLSEVSAVVTLQEGDEPLSDLIPVPLQLPLDWCVKNTSESLPFSSYYDQENDITTNGISHDQQNRVDHNQQDDGASNNVSTNQDAVIGSGITHDHYVSQLNSNSHLLEDSACDYVDYYYYYYDDETDEQQMANGENDEWEYYYFYDDCEDDSEGDRRLGTVFDKFMCNESVEVWYYYADDDPDSVDDFVDSYYSYYYYESVDCV